MGLLAAAGSFAGSAAGSHLAVLLSDGTLRLMMLCILPVAAVIILTRWQAPDRDEGARPLTGARALLRRPSGRASAATTACSGRAPAPLPSSPSAP